ncbi:hypothetical protein ANO14919_107900 [Xylariales sp. No.14919]|nr:hypothetical protein ANO14919_107900 [Xylariales sp. No.14919]
MDISDISLNIIRDTRYALRFDGLRCVAKEDFAVQLTKTAKDNTKLTSKHARFGGLIEGYIAKLIG